METEQKGNKVIYTFRQQKNGYGTNKLGYTNFSSPDSDGDRIKNAMEQLKDKKIVTVTITANNRKTYKRGQRFTCDGNTYILAATKYDEVNLISLADGNHWSDSLKVADVYAVTIEEMKLLANKYGQWHRFKPVEE